MKRLSPRSVKLSFQRKTPKPCLSSSSEKHEKKGLRVRDFPEDAHATTENPPLLRTPFSDQALLW